MRLSIIKPYRLCSLEIYGASVDDDNGGLYSWSWNGSLDAQLILLPLHLRWWILSRLKLSKSLLFHQSKKTFRIGLRRVLASDAHRSIIMKTLHSTPCSHALMLLLSFPTSEGKYAAGILDFPITSPLCCCRLPLSYICKHISNNNFSKHKSSFSSSSQLE